jgi:hypothetical protein
MNTLKNCERLNEGNTVALGSKLSVLGRERMRL